MAEPKYLAEASNDNDVIQVQAVLGSLLFPGVRSVYWGPCFNKDFVLASYTAY
jgi:hypothetical protein